MKSPTIPPADSLNQELLAHVRPPEWTNPTPTGRYQLLVIGGGTAGLVAAAGAAGLGARVALIERDFLGGDCLNFGCVPSKVLLSAARAGAAVRNAEAFGVRAASASIDFRAVMERLRRLRAGISAHDSAQRFRGLGVDVYFGAARFTGMETVDVAGQSLHFRRAVIATGTRPRVPDIPGLAEAGYLTNESVFSLTVLPRRFVVLGAGPVGCELAQAFARLGSRVTLINNKPRPLPREEEPAAALLRATLERDGVRLMQESTLARVEQRANEKLLVVERGNEREEIAADAILVAVGREPQVAGLNLEAAGVAYGTRHGVTVNDHLRTSNPRIFAAGDIASRFKFTHAADALARIAIQNALFPLIKARASALVIPWCTYTDPEVAHVGLTEAEAAARGIHVQTFTQEMADVDRAILDGDTEGYVRIHVRAGSDHILGATIVARHAGEMIGEVSLAMTTGLGLAALGRTIRPYPTQTEALKKLGDAYTRSRFKGWTRWLLERWLKWTR